MKQLLRIAYTLAYSLLLLSCNLYGQSPGGIGRQSLWLRGNFFADQSQTGSLNFNPATDMDRIGNEIKLPGTIKNLKRASIFTVYQHPRLEQNRPVWQMTGGFGDLSLFTSQVSSKSGNMNMVFDKSGGGPSQPTRPEAIISTYLGRQAAQTTSGNENSEALVRFGKSGPFPVADGSSGLIAEFIVYETILKEKEIGKIETYLALKYGITLEKNYVNSLGTTIWNWKTDKLYSNNIAGIGRDDRSTLFQKQGTSCSTPDQLVIGVNKIAPSNGKNTGQLNDRDYLIWGDNAQVFTLKRDDAEQSDIILSEKKWLMKSIGSTANKISTELKIDTKTLLPALYPKELFCLVIDRTGVGDFASKNCTYVTPDSISTDGIASFSGIHWDTDGSGKDVFSFGLKTRLSNDLVTNPGAAKLLSFRLYPNPLTEDGHYSIAVTLDKPGDITVQVLDLQLHLIESKKAAGQAYYLLPGNINAAAGVYIVRLFTPAKEFSQIVIRP